MFVSEIETGVYYLKIGDFGVHRDIGGLLTKTCGGLWKIQALIYEFTKKYSLLQRDER